MPDQGSLERHPSQRPHRAFSRDVGPISIVVLTILWGGLWLIIRPGGGSAATVVGQWLGSQAVLLMSVGLVLISSLPWVEGWFDGIDRAAIWHRRVMIAGMLLLLPHIALATNPKPSGIGPASGAIGLLGLLALVVWAVLPRWRSVTPALVRRLVGVVAATRPAQALSHWLGGYDRWRALHRTTGLFVAAGFVHGLLDATAFGSPVLRWSYVAVGGCGLGFYLYRELLARHFAALHDYQVQAVTALATDLTEISLRPLGRPLEFTAGQFAVLYLEAKDGWHRHPFTIASAPQETGIRVTVKALGDFTTHIAELVKPGMPAVVGGAHGRFDHRRGTDHQIWIAAGVGVAPFLSWIRAAAPGKLAGRVDFFCSTAGPGPFADELTALAARHTGVRLHLVDSSTQGRLDTATVLATVATEPRQLSVFMCGPNQMLATFERELRAAGVPRRNVVREYFDLR
ncbi:MAG: hypothetical protein LBQ06_07660 [Frankiaceae bacterium]|nr:hypothetical protein [Frankiaceae bacterium]